MYIYFTQIFISLLFPPGFIVFDVQMAPRAGTTCSGQWKTVREGGGLDKDLRVEHLGWRDSVTPPAVQMSAASAGSSNIS